MKGKINKAWHEAHKLGMPSTLAERVKWHEAHAKHCRCRTDIPKTIVAELKKQGKSVCSRGHIYVGKGPCPICWPGRAKGEHSRISSGVVHEVPADLRKILVSDSAALAAWEDITPLARNEWICWVESAKKQETRTHRMERTLSELKEGMRRPCCWAGCPHR